MNSSEARAASVKADTILRARSALDRARDELAEVNKHVKPGTHWKVEVCIWRPDSYYSNARPITREVRVPAELVIQDHINKVREAERAFILAGGSYD